MGGKNVIHEAKAPAKVILTGEHFVVHGARAVAAAIGQYLTVTIRESDSDVMISNGRRFAAPHVLEKIKAISGLEHVKVEVISFISRSAGLGSSAAFHTAAVIAAYKAAGKRPDLSTIFSNAMELEAHAHKNPSGVDVWAVLLGGAIIFKRGETPIRLESGIREILLIDSGMRRSTGALVSHVGLLKERNPDMFSGLVEIADSLSELMGEAMQNGDVELAGRIFKMNQGLLKLINVSNERIDEMIKRLEDMGVYSKITGAGGGGYLIGLPVRKASGMRIKVASLAVAGAYELSLGEDKRIY
ncbi:MAG: mevalonate kinase [Nitrososphaeria archaeon]